MQHSILRLQEYRQMLWKNGKGFTYEVAKNGTDEHYDWRISMAEVKEDGSFSDFTGFQRVISVLEGEGIRLTIDNKNAQNINPLSAFAFKGESKTHCALLKDVVKDFNLIYRPDVFRARFQWLDTKQKQSFCSQAQTILIFSAASAIDICSDGLNAQLGCYDSLLLTQNDALTQIDLGTQGQTDASYCCVIELSSL